MARKSAAEFNSAKNKKTASKSWAACGIDTSLTALSVVGVGYDDKTKKRVGPTYAEIRWMPDDDYYVRLGQAAKGHDLLLEVLRELWVVDPDNVFLAVEEPFHYGAAQRQIAGWLKQQSEVAGAFKGSLVRYGFRNIYEINNSQWHAALRHEGVEFLKAPKGSDAKTKTKIKYDNKFIVKTWAIQAFGLPELPDLVKSKSGAKIPRPAEGYGAKAKPDQPSDVYDAAACCAWMVNELERLEIIND